MKTEPNPDDARDTQADLKRQDADDRETIIKLRAEVERLKDAYECNTALMHARTTRMNELGAEVERLREVLRAIEIRAAEYQVHAVILLARKALNQKDSK